MSARARGKGTRVSGRAKHAARFPAGRIGYAVGDIHGRADLLARMFEILEQEPRVGADPPIMIFLGDYVDRGPDNREVIDLLLCGRPEGFERRYLMGNHEAALLGFYSDPVANRAWLNHGGLDTLGDYGVAPLPSLGAGAGEIEAAGAAFRKLLPEAHLHFFNRLERYVTYGDYAFVHAGVDPTRKLEQQRDADLLWIRRRFLESRKSFPYTIVHGHTPAARPFRDARRIGLDTGAYFSGLLSVARFEGEEVRFIEVR